MLQLIIENMTVFWVVIMVLFLVIEAATAGLATIWFAVGALAAIVASLFNAQIWLQIAWFFVISIAALVFTRPLVKKYVNTRTTPTNADMVLGMTGLVTEKIDNLAGAGAVGVGGKVWTARSEEGGVIEAGAEVSINRIEGVKLYVSPIVNESEQEQQ